jgi:hypothetical protein
VGLALTTPVTSRKARIAAEQRTAVGVVDHRHVGIQVEFWLAGERVRALPDPGGGSFDAAGDFDRLVAAGDSALPLLGGVDPHGETNFGPDEMQPLVAEVDLVLKEARPGAEYRGLMRLRTMALRCADERGELLFFGD